MKNLFKITLVSCILFVATSIAQITNRDEAINKAGKQRILVMKMAKSYMAIGAGVKAADAKQELYEASMLFNENINDLNIFIEFKETNEALTAAGVLWTKFRADVNSNPSLDMAPSIMLQANNLVIACNVVVDKYVANIGVKIAVLPNVCAKQRLYAQKIGMLYLAKFWDVKSPTLKRDLNETLANYETSLTSLLQYAENTEEINTILKLQQSEWNFTKKSFNADAEQMAPVLVYSSANLMTHNFDTATVLYAKLIN